MRKQKQKSATKNSHGACIGCSSQGGPYAPARASAAPPRVVFLVHRRVPPFVKFQSSEQTCSISITLSMPGHAPFDIINLHGPSTLTACEAIGNLIVSHPRVGVIMGKFTDKNWS
mmetsp:Transcript_2720/g.4879  ORF Transcript_2720/g.4879 Transcript_2720/m.4879 type:complete len:115 (-) Transcript_2720:93-437(-)